MNQDGRRGWASAGHFANPHGLPAAGHRSSGGTSPSSRSRPPRPDLRRRRLDPGPGRSLVDPAGRSRDVVWTNTNKLLETEGYDGVKTGTTTAAGACLVASGRLGDDHLIVVVLGAGSSEGRYADARNLFRWAWRQRGHVPRGR